MNTIAVIDYGMGNLHSVASALEHVAPDANVLVSSDADIIQQADRIIFPGVGAVRECLDELQRAELVDSVRENAASKPFLGICLGLQMLMDRSEENDGTECLGIIPGEVRYFGDNLQESASGERLKVPHMGWNQVQQVKSHPLWNDIADGSRFYFVHSYYVSPADDGLTAGRCHYGLDFSVALARDNIFAVQFHPEKSQHAGLTLLKNFVAWDGTCN
jgi:glutamine amidotransferase